MRGTILVHRRFELLYPQTTVSLSRDRKINSKSFNDLQWKRARTCNVVGNKSFNHFSTSQVYALYHFSSDLR